MRPQDDGYGGDGTQTKSSKRSLRRHLKAVGLAGALLFAAVAIGGPAGAQGPPAASKPAAPGPGLVPRPAALLQQALGHVAAAAGVVQGFASLDASAARDLDKTAFPHLFNGPLWQPVSASPGVELEGVDEDGYSARVKQPGGKVAIVESTLPLAFPDGDDEDDKPEVVDLALKPGTESYTVEEPIVPIEIARDPSRGIDIGATGFATRWLGTVGGVHSELVGNQVMWANAFPAADLMVSSVPSGAVSSIVVRAPGAREEYERRLTLPAGWHVKEPPVDPRPSVGLHILDAEDHLVAMVSPTAAHDAEGTPLEVTEQLIDGDRLVIRVAHRAPSTRYPLLIDPTDTVFEDRRINGQFNAQGFSDTTWFTRVRSGPPLLWTPDTDNPSQGSTCANLDATTVPFGLCMFAPVGGVYTTPAEGRWRFSPKNSSGDGSHLLVYRADVDLVWRAQAPRSVFSTTLKKGGTYLGVWYPTTASGTSTTTFPSPAIATADSTGVVITHCVQQTRSGDGVCESPTTQAARTAVAGNYYEFGLNIAASSTQALPRAALATGRGGAFWIDDDVDPVLDSYSEDADSNVWYSHQTLNASIAAHQDGLGMFGFGLFATNPDRTLDTVNHGCQGTRASPCPRTWSWNTTYHTDSLSEGVSTVALDAFSATLHKLASPPGWQVKVDRTPPPSVQLSGSLYDSRDQSVGGEGELVLNVNASDSQAGQFRSGVGRIDLKLDGQTTSTAFNKYFVEQSCQSTAGQPCDLSGGFRLNAGRLSDGEHTISVTATDQAQPTPNTTTPPTTFKINVDKSVATLSLGHDPDIVPWGDSAPETPRTVTADARDPDAGIADFTMTKPLPVGGSVTQPPTLCDGDEPVACTDARTTFTYNTDDTWFEGETQDFEITATDKAGNVSPPQKWRLKLDRTPPNAVYSGSLTTAGNPAVMIGGKFGVRVDAADTLSGVRYIRAILDGREVARVDNPNCTIAGCDGELDFFYEVESDKLTSATHTLVLETADQVGAAGQRRDRHVETETYTIVNTNLLGVGAGSGLGYERWQTYDDHPTGADSVASVNEATGNLVWSHGLVDNPGRGVDTNVRLTYNSYEPVQFSGALSSGIYNQAGAGFSVDIAGVTRLNQPLVFNGAVPPLIPAQSVDWVDGDGTRHRFTNAGNNVWTSERGVFLRFRQFSTTDTARSWVITKPDGTTILFDQQGYPRFVSDRNLNFLTIEYSTPAGATQCGVGILNLTCAKWVTGISDSAAAWNGAPNRFVNFTYKQAPGPLSTWVLADIVDHGRRATRFNYDSNARLTTLTEGEPTAGQYTDARRTWRFTWQDDGGVTPTGYLRGVHDPNDRQTQFAYEDGPGSRRVTGVSDRQGRATTYGYSTAVVDGVPVVNTAVTDPKGRVWQARTDTRSDGAAARQHLFESVDPRGVKTTYEWDANVYRPTKRTAAAGTGDAAETNWTWGALGQRLTETAPHEPGAGSVRTTTYNYQVHGGLQALLGIGESLATPTVYDLTSVVPPKGADHATIYRYEQPGLGFQSGNVTQIDRPDTGPQKFEYGNLGLVCKVTLPHGETIRYPDPAQDANPSAPCTLPSSSPAGFPLVKIDEKGKRWQYRYDSVDNLIAVQDPRGSIGNPPAVIGSDNPYTTSYTYDSLDRRRTERLPKRSAVVGASDRFITRTAKLDGNDNQTEFTDGRGKVWKTAYTETDQIRLEMSPPVAHHGEAAASEVTRYAYDATDQVAAVHRPQGQTSGTAEQPTFDENGYVTRYAYDEVDQPVAKRQLSSVNKAGEFRMLVTSYAYDRRGNVIGVADPNHNGDVDDLDAAFNATQPAKQRVRLEYDHADRRTAQVEDPSGLALRSVYRYDAHDNLENEISPRAFDTQDPEHDTSQPDSGFRTTFEYDKADRLKSKTDPLGRRTEWHRRNDGLVAELVSPRGTDTSSGTDFETRFTYDAAGEVIARTEPRDENQYGPEWTINYTRNDVGDPIAISDGRGHTFDNDFLDSGQLRSTERPSWWIYDGGQLRERTPDDPPPSERGRDKPTTTGKGDFGDVKAQATPELLPRAGDTTFQYDNELALTRVTDASGNEQQTIGYDDVGRMIRRTTPYRGAVAGDPPRSGCSGNGPSVEPRGGDVIEDYGYDRNGNMVAVVDGRCQTHTTRFDQFDRATIQDEPANWGQRAITTTHLDRNGNALRRLLPQRRAGGPTPVSRMTYDALDRLTSSIEPYNDHEEPPSPKSETTFGYDAAGNQTKVTRPIHSGFSAAELTTTQRFDRADQLIRSTDGDGAVTEFEYDRDGNQTLVRSPGAASEPGGSEQSREARTRYDGRGLPWLRRAGAGSTARTTITEFDGNRNLRRQVNPAGVDENGDEFGDERPKFADTRGKSDDTGGLDLDSTFNVDATLYAHDEDDLLTDTFLPRNTADNTSSGKVRYKQHTTYNERGWPTRVTGVYKWTTATATTDDTRPATEYLYFATGWIRRSQDKPGADGSGQKIYYCYDLGGNQTSWATPSGSRSETRDYRPDGQMSQRRAQTIPGTPPPDPDSCDPVLSQDDETLRRTYDYEYNPAGELSKLIDRNPPRTSTGDPSERETVITRDVAGRPARINENWDGGRDTLYRYLPGGLVDRIDVDGKLGSGTTYSDGRRFDYAYDNLDRNTRVTVSRDGDNDGRTTTMSYWASGERDHMTKSNGTVEHRYFDDQGLPVLRTERRTGESEPTSADEDRWHAYTYDRNANRTKDERGTYEYNARDQLTRWTHPGKNTAKDPHRDVTYEPLGDGQQKRTRTDVSYTDSGVAVASTTTVENEIVNDQIDSSTSRTTTTQNGAQTDVDNRTLNYDYDGLGSTLAIRTRKFTGDTDPGTGQFTLTTQYTYDPFERLLAARDDRDGDGEIESDPDPQKDETAREVYCYDALDRRDRKVTGVTFGGDVNERTACRNPPSASTTRDYSYLGLSERLTREGTGDGAKTYDYTAAGERLGVKARVSGGESDSKRFRPYAEDAQGNTIAVEHHTGDEGGTAPNPEDHYQLDPYGNTTNESVPGALSQVAKDNPFRYQGHYLDPRVGTYDMQARAYRPTLQRFLSQDRYADPTADLSLQGDPLTNNRYAFLGGNPVGQVELDGHCAADPVKNSCARVTDPKTGKSFTIGGAPTREYRTATARAAAAANALAAAAVRARALLVAKLNLDQKLVATFADTDALALAYDYWSSNEGKVTPGAPTPAPRRLPADEAKKQFDEPSYAEKVWRDFNAFLTDPRAIAAEVILSRLKLPAKAVDRGAAFMKWLFRGGRTTAKVPSVVRVGEFKLPGVPKGATGTPVQTGKGLEYEIPRGTPELDPRVTHVRVMDPVTAGKHQYPDGYIVYMNRAGQTVDPLTGRTIGPSHPFAHLPLK